MMKAKLNPKKILVPVIVAAFSMSLYSCLDDDDNYNYSKLLPNALVTVKTSTDNALFLQLDDSTTLLPVNMTSSPFGDKEVRALTNFEVLEQSSGEYTKAVHVNWIDSILTKQIAPDLGIENDSIYGTDPVDIMNDWVTIAEDGYLTLRFRTKWGDSGKRHFVNLLPGNNPDNPYEVEFRHNAYGDDYGPMAYGLVAFNLDSLPDTGEETVKLKLKWKSYDGDKSTEFKYSTRKSTPGDSEAVASVRNQLYLK